MNTTDELEKARATAARLEEKARAAREAAEVAAAHEEERRARRMNTWDRQVLGLYSPEACEHAVREAQAALEDAMDADPVISAAIRLRAAQGARQGGAILANTLRRRLGMDPVPVPPPGLVALETFIGSYIERRGSELVADAEDYFHEVREEAAASDD